MKTLTTLQQQTLRAVVDCLIPPDDYPGAYEAGVCDYLERLYQTDLLSQLEFCAAGLDSIDTESRFRFAAAFSDLTSDLQSSILRQLKQETIAHSLAHPPVPVLQLTRNNHC